MWTPQPAPTRGAGEKKAIEDQVQALHKLKLSLLAKAYWVACYANQDMTPHAVSLALTSISSKEFGVAAAASPGVLPHLILARLVSRKPAPSRNARSKHPNAFSLTLNTETDDEPSDESSDESSNKSDDEPSAADGLGRNTSTPSRA